MSIALYAQKLWTCVVQCLPYIVKYVVLLHDIAFVFKALIREIAIQISRPLFRSSLGETSKNPSGFVRYSMTDNLKRLEEMALVGCTDQEIAHYFRCTLTPALLDRVRVGGVRF